ncbi:MAG TPA: glycerol-3-phosphate dehydrogenase C-terminal domain-containing protein [Geothermobacteraceae bacterium]|nr:glycerol-3-phosphate dehydrogenase C-terminal domain-containing protein [Geothermobacteraceae bacterium]
MKQTGAQQTWQRNPQKLAESARRLCDFSPVKTDIIAAFSGLRPLIYEQSAQASKISREHQVYRSASGLLSIGGGKYTTYRSLAAEVSELACRLLGHQGPPSQTARQPLPGGDTGNFARFSAQHSPELQADWGWSASQTQQLLGRYGVRIGQFIEFLQQPQSNTLLSDNPVLLEAEVGFAARYEFALPRRTFCAGARRWPWPRAGGSRSCRKSANCWLRNSRSTKNG